MPTLPAYAELHCLSNFTFLRGASHAEELVARAQALGYGALAITDALKGREQKAGEQPCTTPTISRTASLNAHGSPSSF